MPEKKNTHKTGFKSTKEGGYANQRAYRLNNPDKVREISRRSNAKAREKIYEPKVRMPRVNKAHLEKLLSETGLTISELCWGAVNEKYGINFLEPIDKNAE